MLMQKNVSDPKDLRLAMVVLDAMSRDHVDGEEVCRKTMWSVWILLFRDVLFVTVLESLECLSGVRPCEFMWKRLFSCDKNRFSGTDDLDHGTKSGSTCKKAHDSVHLV
eukprot:scaffold5794_cov141-Cylindrotheca_fusiformis.AAC.4